MTITWHGGSTIELAKKKAKLLLNPETKPQMKDCKVIVFDRTDEKRELPKDALMIDWPGEYDCSGFVFRGIENHDKEEHHIAYIFHTGEGEIAWLGEMKKYPSEAWIEELGEVHVLIIPVGGKDVLNAEDAYKLVEAIEPLVVIPICYGEKREGLSAFLQEMDVKMSQPLKSFEMKRSIGGEEQQIELVILEISHA